MFARVLRRAAPHAAGAAAAVTAAAAAAAAASGGGAVGDQCGEQTREGGWRLPVPRAAVLRAEAAPTRAPFPLSSNFIADVADQVGPACVSISAVGTSNGYGGGFFGALSGSAGSGVIVDGERGVVVTNAHVVAGAGFGGAPRNVTVQLQDGRTFKGIVVATDQPTDLAVVQLEPDSATAGVGASADAEGKGDGGLGLPSARFGSSAALRVGEFVVALGCPLLLRWSCSAGIVSALERTSAELGLQGSRTAYIQTDAAINQGNSGGPLVNLQGEVVGINALKAAHADGVSFAVPSDTAKAVVSQLLSKGHVSRPYVGIRMFDLTVNALHQLRARDERFPRSVSAGVIVPGVAPGSPADRAGVLPGDVIVEFDGRLCTSAEQVIERLGYRVGEEVSMVVVRAGDVRKEITLVTEEAGATPGEPARNGWRMYRKD